MFVRLNANLQPFATNAQAQERTIFGSTTQSDDIDQNFNTDFLRGWGITGLNDAPSRQDFNALGYTSVYLSAYLYQEGIPLWNTNQEYFENSVAKGSNGFTYRSKTGTTGSPNSGNDPVSDTVNWELYFLSLNNTVAFTPTQDYHPATKKFVDDAISGASGGILLKSTYLEDSTRYSLSSASQSNIMSFTFTKDNASSDIIIEGVVPVRNSGVGGFAPAYCSVDANNPTNDSAAFKGFGYDNGDNSFWSINQRWSGLSTGSHTIYIGWKTRDGSSNTPTGVVNPNSTDNARFHQTATTLLIREVET